MAKNVMRVIIKGFDHNLVDNASKKIVDGVRRQDAIVSGPIPLPTKRKVITILRAVHKYKDSREQFEIRTYKRLIDIKDPSAKIMQTLQGLEVPAGVQIELKMKNN